MANELGAIFLKTSAKECMGIEDLFNKIWENFIEIYNSSGHNEEKMEKKEMMKNKIEI